MGKILPRTKVPTLSVRTVSGLTWTLADRKPDRFTLIVFYRGLHCPICRGYLGELVKLEPEFRTRGVGVIAISSDDEDRARRATREWQLGNLVVGYGLDLAVARAWGLFISSSRAGPPPASRSQPSSASRACFWCAPMGRSTGRRCRPCRSRGRISVSFSAQSIS